MATFAAFVVWSESADAPVAGDVTLTVTDMTGATVPLFTPSTSLPLSILKTTTSGKCPAFATASDGPDTVRVSADDGLSWWIVTAVDTARMAITRAAEALAAVAPAALDTAVSGIVSDTGSATRTALAGVVGSGGSGGGTGQVVISDPDSDGIATITIPTGSTATLSDPDADGIAVLTV